MASIQALEPEEKLTVEVLGAPEEAWGISRTARAAQEGDDALFFVDTGGVP